MADALINRTFRDLNLNFLPHPANRDLVRLNNQEAIRRSVRNIVLTNFFERHYDSSFGANVTALLFEPVSPITSVTLRAQIEGALKTYEPRITVEDIKIKTSDDESGYYITILFSYKNFPQTGQIDLFLERVR